jgi:hypothetical protein
MLQQTGHCVLTAGGTLFDFRNKQETFLLSPERRNRLWDT